jgi:hypothetical protein
MRARSRAGTIGAERTALSPTTISSRSVLGYPYSSDQSSASVRSVSAQVFHTWVGIVAPPMTWEGTAVDAVYLAILAALYLVTHGLVWALDRLGEPS